MRLFLAVTLAAAPAAAQNVDEVIDAPELNAATIEPLCGSTATGGDVNVSFTRRSTTPPIGFTPELVVWFGSCSTIPEQRDDPSVLLATTTLPTRLTNPNPGNFAWPDDIANEEFTVRDIITEAAACNGDALVAVDKVVVLCAAVNDDPNNDSVSETVEWLGIAEFPVDTESPGTPTIAGITPLDGALRVRVTTTDGADVVEVGVRIRPADDANANDCTLWGVSPEVHTLAEGSGSIDVDAANGSTYQVCVHAIDEVGNESAPSLPAVGTPQDECDLAECFEGKMGARYCGGAPSVGGAALVLLLALVRRIRR